MRDKIADNLMQLLKELNIKNKYMQTGLGLVIFIGVVMYFWVSNTPFSYIQLNKDLRLRMYLHFVRAINKEIFNLTVRLT